MIDNFLFFVEGSVEKIEDWFVVRERLPNRSEENCIIESYFFDFILVPSEVIENNVIFVSLFSAKLRIKKILDKSRSKIPVLHFSWGGATNVELK